MASAQDKYVVDLKGWSLPNYEDKELFLLRRVISKISRASLRLSEFSDRPLSEQLEKREDALHDLIGKELRGMAQELVNEAIDVWLTSLADGNEGQFPELSVDFPYLRGESDVSPLTVAYAVDGGKSARTELLRVDLEAVLEGIVEESEEGMRERVGVVAGALRELANRLERKEAD